jgi:ankyrin repeat protein
MTEFLLSQGANPNHANRLSQTPLMLAADRGYADVVAILLKNKADPCAKDDRGYAVFDSRRSELNPAIKTLGEAHNCAQN